MDIQKRIDQLMEQMTLEEKASLCSGLDFWHTKPIERLGIPSVMMTDGPHGMRKEDNSDTSLGMKRSVPATCFPPAVTCASTWNPDLIYQMGAAMADEARDQEVITILGPGTNIKRSPKGGRNFEYYSEDPYLAGHLAASFINGVQSKGIGTSLKHYAVNSQEYLRMSISEVVDERTFRELYLPAFEYAIKEAQPAQVMCSYNRINGVFSSDNHYLLTQILRDEWGFKGIVVSDWGATNDRVQGIRAGMDLEMPSSYGEGDKKIVKAVQEGVLKEEELDTVARRMLAYILRYAPEVTPDFNYDYTQSHRLARRIATEGAVLLKNEGNLLPLTKGENVAIIGALAQESRYQGSGSSLIVPKQLVHLPQVLAETNQPYEYAAGYTLEGDGFDQKLLDEAVALAKKHDKVVLFVGLTSNYESEGFDRENLDIPRGHTQLIKAVREVCPHVAIVLVGGAPVTTDWAADADAVINMYLAGECAGEAYYDLLFGDVCPSGKLAETYPIAATDFVGDPYFHGGPRTVEHREGLFVGYRYYDTAKKEVRFPFGHGLSYTKFEYSDLEVSAARIYDDETLEVRCTVRNVGERDGAEIVQLYVRDNESTPFRPDKELKGFQKVFLAPGESKQVRFTLDKRSFAYYNVACKDWAIEGGIFTLLVGASSRDIRLQQEVEVLERTPHVPTDLRTAASAYYHLDALSDGIPDKDFEALLGQPIPDNTPLKKGEFDLNSTVRDLQVTRFGRAFAKVGLMAVKSSVQTADMTTLLCLEAGFLDVPVRNFVSMSSGIVNQRMANGVVEWANGHVCKGLGMILGALPAVIKRLAAQNKKAD